MAGLERKNILNMGNGAPGSFYSGGYPGEDIGPGSHDTPWEAAPLSGSSAVTYWYSDSDSGNNANSIKVFVTISESWNATINQDNSIDITYVSTVTDIVKGEKHGYPGTIPRMIKIAEYPLGPWIIDYGNTPMDLGWRPSTLPPPVRRTLHLPPVYTTPEEVGIATIYYKSGYGPHFDDPLPNIYVDAMGMGTSFRNTLPYVYRPGDRKINGTWESHNRTAGKCERIGYGEMKSSNGGTGTNDPPSLKSGGVWYNQRKIGANG